ncbi:MAG: DUF4276 family protein [Phycisphaerae bacterium]|nr:DUF4276 family protein [Phycisphaerae bacterium]
MKSHPQTISAAVEGPLDEVVARRLVESVGASIANVYGRNGKPALLARIEGYNNAARFAPWFVLIDLDGDGDCAPPARARWLPNAAPRMCFRIAVREVEAWLLADRTRFAQFLKVNQAWVVTDPETLPDPKQVVVNLARKSRNRAIREDIAPRPGSGRSVGPAYVSRMIEFVQRWWSPTDAARSAPSLERAMSCLRRLAAGQLAATC